VCNGKMEKGTASVVAACVAAAIAMARWRGGRRAQRVWLLRSRVAAIAIVWLDCNDKMETKIRGDGIFQFLLHI
jgi:hypothetical protein